MSKIVVQKPSDEENEFDEEKQAWLQNPMTNAVRESVLKNMRVMLTNLLGACGKSTDPEVRGFHAQYHELKVMLAMLEEGK